MEIDCSRNTNPKLARVLSLPIRQVHRVHGRKGTAITRPLPSVPSFELTGMWGSNRVARQRALICDSLNDQQGSDHLPGSTSHQTTFPRIAVVGKHEPESQ